MIQGIATVAILQPPKKAERKESDMEQFSLKTTKRSQMVDITGEVEAAVRAIGQSDGLVTVFCPHTTGAITINENADPSVQSDMIQKLDLLAPAPEPFYTHMEGNSDSHVKSTLVGASEQIILADGRLQLGTWQGIYFCEFDGPRSRKIWVSVTC